MADLNGQDDMTERTCSVDGCARRHSGRLAPRRYHLNETFFDEVDTEEKAYWLGFITADGCVRTGGKFNLVSVKLKDSDVGHLEKFKAATEADYPIRFAARRGIAGPSAMLAMSSRHLTDALADLGVTPRKSMTATPWRGPSHLMRHYWRGMVDGDGSIGRQADRRNHWSVNLCGSVACVDAFAEWSRAICGSSAKAFFQSNVWRWTVAGLAAPQSLVRELYAEASIYLDRKYLLAQRLMALVPVIDLSNRTELCLAEGCRKSATVHNMCQLHYRYAWVADGPECSVEGCHKKRFARGYCGMHYARLRRFGTTDSR